MTAGQRLSSIRVVVDRPPDPFLLGPAIEARIAGRPWPVGPEAEVADAVARAIDAEGDGDLLDSTEHSTWR